MCVRIVPNVSMHINAITFDKTQKSEKGLFVKEMVFFLFLGAVFFALHS